MGSKSEVNTQRETGGKNKWKRLEWKKREKKTKMAEDEKAQTSCLFFFLNFAVWDVVVFS